MGTGVQESEPPEQAFDAAAYLALHPDLAEQKETVLDLAYEEFCQHEEAGAAPDLDAFCDRFPFKTSLRRLIHAHCFLEDNPKLLDKCQPLDWPETGETFQGFRLQQKLGEGAFARVFLATEPALGQRQVAVKISIEGAAEAQTLGRLIHANIVPVHSVQQDPVTGLTVVCMPYLGSATLCDLLDQAFAQGPPPQRARVILAAARGNKDASVPAALYKPRSSSWGNGTYTDGVLHLGCQLADALAFIHDQGICHRDLKPSNVLLCPDGTPMLLDFNLSSDDRLGTLLVGGTLPYMSPEQLLATDTDRRAESSLIEPRSDIFSLGVILYELLTGTHPFGPISLQEKPVGQRRQLLERQRVGPWPLRQANSQVDAPLARLVERCLAYNPNDRPGSAAQLALALKRYQSWLWRWRRWAGQHKGRATALATGVLLAAGSLGTWTAVHTPRSIQQFQRGEAAYQARDYERAAESFDTALVIDPHYRAARFWRGRANQQQGMVLWAKGLQLGSARDTLQLKRLQQAPFQRAAEDFRNLDPLEKDGPIQACLGFCLNHLGKHDLAWTAYQKAKENEFAPAAVWNNLGYTYLQRGEFVNAQQSFGQALRLQPNLSPALHNQLELCRMEAVRWLTQLQLDSPVVNPLKRTVREAVAQFEKDVPRGPVAADVYYEAARVSAAVGDLEVALNYLTKALEGGQNPKLLKQEPLFFRLQSRSDFQALLTRPAAPQPLQKSPRLIDPLCDSPQEVSGR
jgi:serine/threonine protein kinase/Tfp pilus assembly protein PilF